MATALAAPAAAAARAPAACTASGQSNLTFESDFRGDSKQFDAAMSYRPGYRWYRWNWFNVRPDPSRAQIVGGALTVREPGGGFSGHVTSAALSVKAPGFVGTAFGGGACVEVKLRFVPDRLRSAPGHPSFWSMSIEHLANRGADRWPGKPANYSHFLEWDIFEYFKVPEPGFLSSWIDWFGSYVGEGTPRTWFGGCERPYCKNPGSFKAKPGAVPESTDWRQWQTIIGLWVPATGTNPGYIQTFFNGRAIAPPKYWPGANTTVKNDSDLLNFSWIDRQHQVFVISSGAVPMQVQSVRVWQKTTKYNLSN